MKIVCVGYGSIGRRHLGNILALAAAGSIDTGPGEITVVDKDADQRESATGELGVKAGSSLEEALEASPEAVLICTPSHLHVPMAVKALKAGCHVFIEKPLSTTREGLDELEGVLAASNRTCLVACNMWFHPGIVALRDLIGAGEIGRPTLFRSYWGHHIEQWHPGADLSRHYSLNKEQGGGSLFDVGAHEFFFVPEMLGAIKEATASLGPSGNLASEIDDFSHTTVKLESNVRGVFEFNFLDRCRRRLLEIVGEKATIVWSSMGKSPMRERLSLYPGNGPWREIPLDGSPAAMYLKTMEHFFNCIAGREKPVQSLGKAREVLNVILTLHEKGVYAAGEDKGRIQ